MITPDDIQTKEFKKGLRGYDEQDVDEFLDQLTLDLEAILAENQQLKAEKAEMTKTLGEYKNQEGAVVKTLESAKALMNDISASAEKRAEILIKNAELDADQIVRSARDSVERLREEEKDLTQRVSSIRLRIKNILGAELERIEDMERDIFGVEKSNAPVINTSEIFSGSQDSESEGSAQSQTVDMTKTIVSFRSEENK